MNVESWVKEKDGVTPSLERLMVPFRYQRIHVNVEPHDVTLYLRNL